MSNVSTSHNVQKLDKSSKALTGQRMARVIAKKDKDGQYLSANLTESKYVSVPLLTVLSPEQVTSLRPHIIGMLNDAQDALIRERIVSDGATAIHEDEISADKCIAYLDDAAKGNRVTGQYLQQWFMDTYYNSAMEFVSTVCRFDAQTLTEEQMGVIEKKSNVLRDMFAGFASPKYRPEIPQCKAMIRFGEFLGADNTDARMESMIKKVEEVKKVREEELSMDALGFE